MSCSGRSIRLFVEQELGSLPHFVIYAFLEWTLIGLLFLDGFLAFISSEFADFFDLQPPCMLCTRIDHILTRHKSRYCYNETICDGHKKDLSSLAYCQVHRKLSDINTMCEGCLLSFATDSSDKSDVPLIGVLNTDQGGLQDVQQHWNDTGNGNGNLMHCSCCGEPMKVKPTIGYQNNTINGGNVANTSLFPNSVPSRLSQQTPAPSPAVNHGSWRGEEARSNLDLSHIRCQDLKMSGPNTPRSHFGSWREEEAQSTLELPHIRCQDLKTSGTTTPEEKDTANVSTPTVSKEEIKPLTTPRQPEADDSKKDFGRTHSFARGNTFFGISDSAASSPRFSNRMSRKSLLDKVELSSDPVDEITENETDTEIILDRLKKQVRSDRKSLIALHLELDEERSASAVAANNAMAMITKLQAEKASVQMEALQYQRMMEEQAEYDKEDIQMLKDFLNKKEEEIRDLESELDLYRDRYGLPHVGGSDGLERSQSFSSISEQGSPLFSIVAADTEIAVHDNISENGSNDGDYVGATFEEGEKSLPQRDAHIHEYNKEADAEYTHDSNDNEVDVPNNDENGN